VGTKAYKKSYQKQVSELMLERTPTIVNCLKVNEQDESVQSCSRMTSDLFCNTFAHPAAKWRNGDCPMADSFLKVASDQKEQKVRVGQQKQSKKKSRR
jgi:hypothetical protein